MNFIKLTDSEVNHLLNLLDSNDSEGSYYGNERHWRDRSDKLKEKLNESIKPFNFEVVK